MNYTFLGILAGVTTRMFVPYLVKLRNNPNLRWKNKYVISAFAGLLLSLLAAFLVSQYLTQNLGFIGGFTAAYTLHSLSREVQKSLGY